MTAPPTHRCAAAGAVYASGLVVHELGEVYRMRLAQGRTDAAAAAARRLLTETGDVVRRSKVLAGCTELPIAAGDVDAAREAAAELNDIALRFGCTALLVQAASCRAAVELADGGRRLGAPGTAGTR